MRWMMIALFMMVTVVFAGEDAGGVKANIEKAKTLPEVDQELTNYATSISGVIGAYLKVLNSEEESVTKKGDLDSLEMIKKEKEIINVLEPSTSNVDWKKNKNLATAQKNFNVGLGKAKKDYLTKLEGVQKKFVQDKKIDEAKLVKLLLEELKLEEVKKMIVGKWDQSKQFTWIFSEDGTFTVDSEKGEWKIVGEQIITTRPNKVGTKSNANFNIMNSETLKRISDGKLLNKIE